MIDALDECGPKRRHELLQALDQIIQCSASLVKVFVSSRDDNDIVCHLERSQNIFIKASDNGDDIKRYVNVEVEKAISERRLLCGEISETLQEKIKETLISGAQGMFRWVSLQIDNLCDPERMKHEEDISAELGRLPRTLKDSYTKIHERIESSGPSSKDIARRTICWLLCARVTLEAPDFITAISVDSNGQRSKTTPKQLLSICSNLVVLDNTLDIFRFAHLSVREYFETQVEYQKTNTHGLVLERCFHVFTPDFNSKKLSELDRFEYYAAVEWLYHGTFHQKGLIRLCFDEVETSQAFKAWELCIREAEAAGMQERPGNRVLGMLKRPGNRSTGMKLGGLFGNPSTVLFIACRFCWTDVLDHLSTFSSFNWDQFNVSGNLNALLMAVNLLKFPLAQRLLHHGANANAVSEHRKPLIVLWACCDQYYTRVNKIFLKRFYVEAQCSFLVKAGANVNAVDQDDRTALASLVAKDAHPRNFDKARALVLERADVNIVDCRGETALQKLFRRGWGLVGSTEGVEILLDAVTDFADLVSVEEDLICFAAKYGFPRRIESAVRFLLQRHHDALCTYGMTALYYHSQKRRFSFLELLLATNEIDLNAEAIFGHQPSSETLHVISRLMAPVKIDVNAAGSIPRHHSDVEEIKWIQHAISCSHNGIARVLLEAGADCNLDFNGGCTALHYAARSRNDDIVPFLINAGCSIDTTDSGGRTALHLAVDTERLDIVHTLLDAGCSTNATDSEGRTALHLAVEQESLDIVHTLLHAGCSRNATNFEGRTALHIALTQERPDVVHVLLEAGCNINALDSLGYSPLQIAIRLRNEGPDMKTVHNLLGAGCSTDTVSNGGWTALHYSVAKMFHECVRALLKAGCNINMPTRSGHTPLHIAADNLDTKMIQLLEEAGCDVDARDSKGRTAQEVADFRRQAVAEESKNTRSSPTRV